MFWWGKASSSPPLAIIGPPPSLNSFSTTGVVFVPTSPGFGGLLTNTNSYHVGTDNALGSPFNSDDASVFGVGSRISLGALLTEGFGLEARYLALYRSSQTNTAGGGGQVIAAPYIDATTGAPSAYIVNAPAAQTGLVSTQINTTPDVFVGISQKNIFDGQIGQLSIRSTASLQSPELNGVWNIARSGNSHLDAIVGVRYVELDESLTISSNMNWDHIEITNYQPALGLPFPLNTPLQDYAAVSVGRSDFFRTQNRFVGGQLGASGEWFWNRFSVSLDGQVALGTMHQVVTIDGVTTATTTNTNDVRSQFTLAGIPLTGTGVITNLGAGPPNIYGYVPPTQGTGTTGARGGLYAQPSNIGRYSRDVFAVVPEGILKLNYRVTDRITANVGYTFLYMNTVARPGDQVNPVVNPAFLQIPPTTPTTAVQPAFRGIVSNDYWVQGLTLGVELKF
jgi:hypothetical protein